LHKSVIKETLNIPIVGVKLFWSWQTFFF